MSNNISRLSKRYSRNWWPNTTCCAGEPSCKYYSPQFTTTAIRLTIFHWFVLSTSSCATPVNPRSETTYPIPHLETVDGRVRYYFPVGFSLCNVMNSGTNVVEAINLCAKEWVFYKEKTSNCGCD